MEPSDAADSHRAKVAPTPDRCRQSLSMLVATMILNVAIPAADCRTWVSRPVLVTRAPSCPPCQRVSRLAANNVSVQGRGQPCLSLLRVCHRHRSAQGAARCRWYIACNRWISSVAPGPSSPVARLNRPILGFRPAPGARGYHDGVGESAARTLPTGQTVEVPGDRRFRQRVVHCFLRLVDAAP